MSETGQPGLAPANADIAESTAAFKSFLTGDDDKRPRDEQGRFAREAGDEAQSEGDLETEAEQPEAQAEGEYADDEAGNEYDEGTEDGQPDADIPMPVSWSKDDADLWAALPVEARAKVAERETQRDQAINLKFQEAANVRRLAEQQAQEAAYSRNAYIQQLQSIEAQMMPHKPDASMLHPQSPNYDPDTYHLMRAQYEQGIETLTALRQQRAQAEAEAHAQQQAMDQHWRQSFEQQWQPVLLQTVPELTNPATQAAVLDDLTRYALANGYDHDQLQAATSADILTLWKARQFDRQQQATQRVKANARPQPQRAAPAIRPGVTQPASVQRKTAADRVMARLNETGSLEDGAAAFKLTFKSKR